eukprot:973179-Pleurochrysis_carterae.AAC.1
MPHFSWSTKSIGHHDEKPHAASTSCTIAWPQTWLLPALCTAAAKRLARQRVRRTSVCVCCMNSPSVVGAFQRE